MELNEGKGYTPVKTPNPFPIHEKNAVEQENKLRSERKLRERKNYCDAPWVRPLLPEH
jgi:hypothetical protein